MKSKWNNRLASECNDDLLALRVYTSRLLGEEEDLVLHGGGNTSVKITEKNIFGEEEEILYVKGSGWDLATIEAPGFAPVKMDALHKLAALDHLTDVEMVRYQRMAMINPAAPNPSVETILHGIIPYTFVDHTHADAVVTITNTPNGASRIKEIYGDNMMIVPYVMPGFILAKEIYKMTRGINWDELDGMILLNHGVFTFDHDAKQSYEKMIDIVTKAEEYLEKKNAKGLPKEKGKMIDGLKLAKIRKAVATKWKRPILSRLNAKSTAVAFSNLSVLESVCSRGPLTPDHIIRTKRVPILLGEQPEIDLNFFVKAYDQYFINHSNGEQTKLDPAPRWGVYPGSGTLSFGKNVKELQIIQDITDHTQKAIYQAEKLASWKTLGPQDLFDMEYWSLEQAKLKKAKNGKPFGGKIALVTGAANGIGKACVEALVAEGAVVAALDINPDIEKIFEAKEVLGLVCDITDRKEVKKCLQKTAEHFGGLDLVISNAGIFPDSTPIKDMKAAIWEKSIQLNLTSHQQLLQQTIPYLELGFDPAIVFIGSKNVPAPGPGASAYSVAKAGLTQLARVAAFELGPKGIRVNTIHPNAVYDTGIWTEEVLHARASSYNLSVKDYKTRNVLKTEITSLDVAQLAVLMLGNAFSKITGAQIPIDGGNDRVI